VARSIEESTALVIGAGCLGGPAALVLAGAGVGHLLLVDAAVTGQSDLSRQPGLAEADLGRPRAAALAGRLGRLFPGVAAEAIEAPFAGEAAAALVARAGVVVHATGDAALAFAANDAAMAAGRPLVHGGVLHLSAQLLSVVPGRTGCLRCLFEVPPPGAAAPGTEAAILGPLAGLAGALMGQEAVRLLLGQPATYAGRLLTYGARAGQGRLVPVRPRPGCPACEAAQLEPPTTQGAA
jgi:adenylyltransferase/sulfurtransferase